MGKLTAQFGSFNDAYDGSRMRTFVAELERVLAKLQVDGTKIFTDVASGSTHTASAEDSLLLCNTSTGAVRVQFGIPSSDLVRDKHEINVKKDTTGNALYIDFIGGAVSDFGTETLVVLNKGTSLCFRAVVGGWRIV